MQSKNVCSDKNSANEKHTWDQVKRTDQPYNTQPRSSVAGPFFLPDVTHVQLQRTNTRRSYEHTSFEPNASLME